MKQLCNRMMSALGKPSKAIKNVAVLRYQYPVNSLERETAPPVSP